MERRKKRNLENTMDKNYIIWIVLGLVVLALATFFISYNVYNKKLKMQYSLENMENDIANSTNNILNNIAQEEASKTSLSIGKTVNEIENEQVSSLDGELNNEENESEKIAVNTSAIEQRVVAERKQENNIENEKGNNQQQVNVESVPRFTRPVDGEIIKDFSRDNLVYSETLEEWTTHLGIDYKAEKTSIVKSAGDGFVKAIKNDPRYGLTVIIEHENGYTTMYANLLSTEFIKVGEEVKQGQTIATVGNTATFEIADETHLHFEIIKDGISLDPNLFID